MIGIKKAIIGTGAAFVMGGATILGAALPASAATPSCGNTCVSLFPQKYENHYFVDVYQQKAVKNNEVILFQGSNSDPALDFTYSYAGTVDSFYHHYHLVSAAFDHTYGSDPAFELQYSPYGVNSGLCLSTWPGEVPAPGFKVRLEACGAYSNSLWAADVYDNGQLNDHAIQDNHSDLKVNGVHYDVPFINGATNSFSSPEVLNYPAGHPTDLPRPVLNVQPENTYSGGQVFDNQEWGVNEGLIN